MKRYQKVIVVSLFCFLLLSGCTSTAEESPTPEVSETPSGSVSTVTVAARFQQEDDTPLVNETVRISDRENSMDYPLDEEGRLQITGLPKVGTYTVSVLEDGKEAGAMTLNLSVGAVIDAATDADGIGHVTLKEDTETVSLDFVLDESGILTCSLRLSAHDGQETNMV